MEIEHQAPEIAHKHFTQTQRYAAAALSHGLSVGETENRKTGLTQPSERGL